MLLCGCFWRYLLSLAMSMSILSPLISWKLKKTRRRRCCIITDRFSLKHFFKGKSGTMFVQAVWRFWADRDILANHPPTLREQLNWNSISCPYPTPAAESPKLLYQELLFKYSHSCLQKYFCILTHKTSLSSWLCLTVQEKGYEVIQDCAISPSHI